MKIKNDKYYTPKEIVQEVYNKTKELIKIKEPLYIEPSAGNGAFLDVLDTNNEKYLAYDLFPEDKRILTQDFLTLNNLMFQEKNIIIGNPPFGGRGGLIKRFLNKAKTLSNYVSFILPISYLNKYDPIYSKDLGQVNFSGVKLRVCHNIYDLRISNFNIIKLDFTDYKLFDVRSGVKTIKHKNFDSTNFNLVRFCLFGSAAGKIIKDDNKTYAKELHFYINNNAIDISEKLSFELINLKHISTPSISMHTCYLVLKEIIEK